MTELKPRYLIPESHLEFKALRLEWKFAENVPSVQLHRHKIRFYAFLEASEKKGVLLFSQGLRSVNMSITITLSSNISCCKTDSTDRIS